MRKEKLKAGESFENGILFYSESHPGYIAIATADINGVKTKWTKYDEFSRIKNKEDKESNINLSCFYTTILVWIILCLLFLLGIKVFSIGLASITAIYFTIQIQMEDKMQRTKYRKYHAAEHMTIKAYNKLKRVPTIEEIRRYSRFSNKCSTNIILLIVVTCAVLFVGSFIQNPLIFIMYFCSSEIIVYIIARCGFLNFLQIFTTDIPSDRELRVSIKALIVWIEHDEKE